MNCKACRRKRSECKCGHYECSACKLAVIVLPEMTFEDGTHQSVEVIKACKCDAPINAPRTAKLKGTGSCAT